MLETLLKEESNIKDKISGALTALKEWFLDKIEQVKEIFTSIKNKTMDKLRSLKSGSVCSKDIKSKDGEIICSKGDGVEKVKGKFRTLLGKLKKESDDTITECKDGVNAIGQGNNSKATEKKSKASGKLIVLKSIVITIASLTVVGAAMHAKGTHDEKHMGDLRKRGSDFEAAQQAGNTELVAQ